MTTEAKLEAMKTFWKLQKDMGMDIAMEAFQGVLVLVENDLFHDPLGCLDCQICGDWEYCKHSCYHLHVCLESQVCFCLNPKYPYNHFN